MELAWLSVIGNDVAVASVLVLSKEEGTPTEPDGPWYPLDKDAPEVGRASVADFEVAGTSVGRALVCGVV